MNLEKLNLVELNTQEILETEGGSWIKKGIWGAVVAGVIENWDDIKQGLSDGWNKR